MAIARAILKNAPIVLLDEATSSLDVETEQGVMRAIRHLSQGRTSLTIAHRLSTIMDSDEILVMLEGRIAERGTHQELHGEGRLVRPDVRDPEGRGRRDPGQGLARTGLSRRQSG